MNAENKTIVINATDAMGIKNRMCYLHNGRNASFSGQFITLFDDMLTSVIQPKYDNAMFFIEAKCAKSGIADLRPRYGDDDSHRF